LDSVLDSDFCEFEGSLSLGLPSFFFVGFLSSFTVFFASDLPSALSFFESACLSFSSLTSDSFLLDVSFLSSLSFFFTSAFFFASASASAFFLASTASFLRFSSSDVSFLSSSLFCF